MAVIEMKEQTKAVENAWIGFKLFGKGPGI